MYKNERKGAQRNFGWFSSALTGCLQLHEICHNEGSLGWRQRGCEADSSLHKFRTKSAVQSIQVQEDSESYKEKIRLSIFTWDHLCCINTASRAWLQQINSSSRFFFLPATEKWQREMKSGCVHSELVFSHSGKEFIPRESCDSVFIKGIVFSMNRSLTPLSKQPGSKSGLGYSQLV